MSSTIFRLMSSETIIGDVVDKNVQQGTLIVRHPVLLETVVADNGNKYILMRDILKDSAEIHMPINAVNIMYHYPAAPSVEAYYKGCVPEFQKAKVDHQKVYVDMLSALVEETLEENEFEIQEGQFLQPSSKTMN